ncbi:hypothetical protein [Terasakiella sp.]|uniref:hypothetical protein n=1 Tax=Terasakiella sp. TaxID=2034861 RepID=UPI003AFFC309
MREVWHTPAHHLGFWQSKLARRNAGENKNTKVNLQTPTKAPEPVVSIVNATGGGIQQFDFGF